MSICTLSFPEKNLIIILRNMVNNELFPTAQRLSYRKALSLIIGASNCYCDICKVIAKDYWLINHDPENLIMCQQCSQSVQITMDTRQKMCSNCGANLFLY